MARDNRYDASLDDCAEFPPTVCDHDARRDYIMLETIDHDPDTNIVIER